MKRIAVVSEDLRPPWHEEIQKFAWSVGRALATDHDVMQIDVGRAGSDGAEEADRRIRRTRGFMSRSLRRELRSFSPDAVLYVPAASATMGGFLRCLSLRRHVPHAALGMAALVARRHAGAAGPLLRAAAPDVLFVSSYRSLLQTRLLSLSGELVPTGFDPSTFRRPHPGEREMLREAYGITPGSYVCLHVGPVIPGRNLSSLIPLAGEPGSSVIVVTGGGRSPDGRLRAGLERAGVRVLDDRASVSEWYHAADCFVFPVQDGAEEVEVPPGVFEALASGVPVVSTPFGGLRDFLQAGEDLHYIERGNELLDAVSRLRERGTAAVRPMDAYTWERIARRIVEVLGGRAVSNRRAHG
jgi:glycosyltransferase involved in cell wall biosynthesis